MSTNVCVFSGCLGKNPEITKLSSGKEKVKFDIAVIRDYKQKDGSRQTDWFDVIIWGSANYVRKVNLGKGDKVIVSGRYEKHEYNDNEGKKRYYEYLNCKNIELIAHRKSDKDKATEDALAQNYEEDDLPF